MDLLQELDSPGSKRRNSGDIAAEGKAVDGPETTGSYVWFEAPDWKRLEEKFIYGPYIHHVAGVYGKYADAIQEAARYLPVEWDDLSVGPRSL